MPAPPPSQNPWDALYPPGSRVTQTAYGWVPSPSGRPIEEFVMAPNANGQGGHLVPRDQLPAGFEPGMALRILPNGSYEALPYTGESEGMPYSFWDYGSGTGIGIPNPPSSGGGGGGGGSGGIGSGGGLPPSPGGGGLLPPPEGGGLPPSPPSGGGSGGSNVPEWHLPYNPPVGTPPAGGGYDGGLGGLINMNPTRPPGLNVPGRDADYGVPGGPVRQNPGFIQPPQPIDYQYDPRFGIWSPNFDPSTPNPYYTPPTTGGPPPGTPPPMQPPPMPGGPLQPPPVPVQPSPPGLLGPNGQPLTAAQMAALGLLPP